MSTCPHCGAEPEAWSRKEECGGSVFPPDDLITSYSLKEKWSEGDGEVKLYCETEGCLGSIYGFFFDDEDEWEWSC
jgi:hypothetical protein